MLLGDFYKFGQATYYILMLSFSDVFRCLFSISFKWQLNGIRLGLTVKLGYLLNCAVECDSTFGMESSEASTTEQYRFLENGQQRGTWNIFRSLQLGNINKEKS